MMRPARHDLLNFFQLVEAFIRRRSAGLRSGTMGITTPRCIDDDFSGDGSRHFDHLVGAGAIATA